MDIRKLKKNLSILQKVSGVGSGALFLGAIVASCSSPNFLKTLPYDKVMCVREGTHAYWAPNQETQLMIDRCVITANILIITSACLLAIFLTSSLVKAMLPDDRDRPVTVGPPPSYANLVRSGQIVRSGRIYDDNDGCLPSYESLLGANVSNKGVKRQPPPSYNESEYASARVSNKHVKRQPPPPPGYNESEHASYNESIIELKTEKGKNLTNKFSKTSAYVKRQPPPPPGYNESEHASYNESIVELKTEEGKNLTNKFSKTSAYVKRQPPPPPGYNESEHASYNESIVELKSRGR